MPAWIAVGGGGPAMSYLYAHLVTHEVPVVGVVVEGGTTAVGDWPSLFSSMKYMLRSDGTVPVPGSHTLIGCSPSTLAGPSSPPTVSVPSSPAPAASANVPMPETAPMPPVAT